MNNAANLYVVRNSGTFNFTRPITMNGTSNLVLGNGGGTVIAAPIAWNGTTNTLNVNAAFTLSGPWTGAATVNKTSGGALTLNGSNGSFTGTLNVNAGRVTIDSPFGGKVTQATGSQLAGESTVAGLLTLNGGTLVVDAATPGNLTASNGLTLAGTTTLSFTQVPAVGASTNVLTYAGTLTGSTANLAVTGARTPVFSDVGGVISLSLGNAARTWTNAAANGLWDIGASANWQEGDNKFFQGDSVSFGDTGFGTVAITGVLTPSSITINNAEFNDYVFTAAANNLIGGSTGLTKSGAGTVTIGGVNTFTGNIAVNGGVLKPSGNQAFGLGPKTITVASGATLDTSGAMNANRDYDAVIAGSGQGSGVITNSGATHQNGFRSLTLSADATIGGSGRWDLRPITAGQALIDLANHKLTKTGGNFIALVDGTMSNPGTIDIETGTLSFTRSVVSGSGAITVKNGAILLLENYTSGSFSKQVVLEGSTFRNTGANLTSASDVSFSGASTISVGVGNTFTLTNPVSGTGTLTKADTGILALAAANTYDGGTTVAAGVVQIGNGGTTGSVLGNIDLASLTSGVSINRTDDFTFTNVITGSGLTGNALNPAAMNKNLANTVTLVAANTYTGTTRLGAGMIAIGSDASVFGDATALIDLRNGGIRSSDASPRTIPNPISFSVPTPFGSAGTGKLTFSGAVAYGSATKSITVNNAETEFSGVIAGTGVGTFLAKDGPGKLILSGNNTYTQITQINAGVLQLGNGGSTGSFGPNGVTNNTSLVINLSNPEGFDSVTVGNVISGPGSLTHIGPSLTVLSALNTYSGDTIITNGTLSPNQQFLSDTAAVRISGTGKLELLSAATDVVGSLYLDGVPQAPGLWGRPGSVTELGADFETPFITFDGLLSVTTNGAVTPYATWATDKGLTAANDDFTDNPDSDGLDNLGEFAFDGDPLSGVTGGKVVVKVANVGGTPALTLTLPVRTAVGTFAGGTSLTATADGVTYTIEGSDTLDGWTLDIDEVTGPDATAIQEGLDLPELSDEGWIYRTFRSPGAVAGDPKEFLRARVQ
ncbi:beta strand repeat-containing protein [Luteolibacter sp. Populi]|uniref:beta strand repeat-containing protein n=1 Tax=Luteolibacter sp. Populi TaxID=3230487 RepID=UPI00346726E7